MVGLGVMALLLVLSRPAHGAAVADGPDWFAEPFAYALVDQDIRGALNEFGHNLGLLLVMSDKVHGKARSPVRSELAGEFLTQLCDSNGLAWYFDGNILYVTAADEVATRLVRRGPGLDPQALHDHLAELDVKGSQLSMRQGAGGDELYISGPPAYLGMLEQHLDTLRQPAAQTQSVARGIRVFRGATISDH